MEILIIYGIAICCIIIYIIYRFIKNIIDKFARLKKLEQELPVIKKMNKDLEDIKNKMELELSNYKAIVQELPVIKKMNKDLKDNKNKMELELSNYKTTVNVLSTKIDKVLSLQNDYFKSSSSNLTAIPYMASIMADYETYGIEILAQKLSWGNSVERAKKVASIREIRKAAQQMIERNMEAKYQLDYLLSIFPNLQDIVETDYTELPFIKIEELSNYDHSRDWLSKEEYNNLNSIERNQLALDRYKASHNKTKWQIGRDYELYVGYKYGQKGYTVDYFGSYMGLEDLGRDLIAKKDDKILIIQCKYWSKNKQIHEKHITQLYGTVASYCIENKLPKDTVKGLLVTNICLSDMAKNMASYLNIDYVENYAINDYPCIKCNINYDEFGIMTKIYHLPFDQKYDDTKITKKDEFFAMTVQEAEAAGFRRAFKWFKNN